jgi:hypothetical protein
MPTLRERIKSFYVNNPWKGRLILSFVVILLVLTMVRILLPQTIIYSATTFLKNQGIDSSIEKIGINIFDGTISLINAKGSKDTKPLFDVGLIEIHWEWAPLSERTFEVTKVALDTIAVNIEQYNDEIIIGGVHIPLSPADNMAAETENTDKTQEITTWAASLGEVVLGNLNICYLQHTSSFADRNDNTKLFDYCLTLEEMSWDGTVSYATDRALLNSGEIPLTSSGDFVLRGLDVIDNKLNRSLLSSSSNDLHNVVIHGLNDIQIDQLDMNDLSAMQREDKQHIDSVHFQQLTIDNIKLSNLNSLKVDSVKLSEPGLYLVKQNPTDWEYMQWLPPSSNTESPAVNTEEKANSETTPFSLTVNRVAIDNSDFCYLDKGEVLYYCFTLADFNWSGSLKYDSPAPEGVDLSLAASGDLTLQHPNIHNHTLHRNLLDFKSLTLSDVTVSDGNKLALKELLLNELTALQRSEKPDDNTLSFDSLKISDFSYSNNSVAINTIRLDGLADTVSINKDGQWEHSKWRPKTNKEENTSTTDNNKSPQNKNDLMLSLNNVIINSEKDISFTDNSTEPVMEVGLQELLIDFSHLDTTKPDTDSAFKLMAKTSRHSTIDLEGTVRPFAEKVSLDATGKLKGFDLRAASPATKKAIGHIIKSGQLDADITLTATEGILDSNIALSLYHFNIKPMSKADAAELDKKFGMPLNQTLVLLRDKDDSIHLDIPITGDINNPEFNPYDAIIKATSKAATVTLVTFYTPYGLIYAGGNALFNIATALNFDPLEFKPGSAELQQANKEQLDKLAKLMTDKPQIHLTLCGVSNQSDLFALFPETRKLQDEKNTGDVPLTAEQANALKKLAMERQTNSKEHLIKAANIEHDRLILCEPEHRTGKDAIAGVEINI